MISFSSQYFSQGYLFLSLTNLGTCVMCIEPKGTSMLDLQQFDLFIRTTGECG